MKFKTSCVHRWHLLLKVIRSQVFPEPLKKKITVLNSVCADRGWRITIKKKYVVCIVRGVLQQLLEIGEETFQESWTICERQEHDGPMDIGIVGCSIVLEKGLVWGTQLFLKYKRGSFIAGLKIWHLCGEHQTRNNGEQGYSGYWAWTEHRGVVLQLLQLWNEEHEWRLERRDGIL